MKLREWRIENWELGIGNNHLVILFGLKSYYCSLLITHYSLLITHYSLLITYYLLLTMPAKPHESLSPTDSEELEDLVNTLELSDRDDTIIAFAVAPDSGPQHPVVVALKSRLAEGDGGFEVENFFLSDCSLMNFVYHEYDAKKEIRRLLLVFGIQQLSNPRRTKELKRLNLGREQLFRQKIVLIFILNQETFLAELRDCAPDFWDWRGKVALFETRPPLDPLFYPYLESLITDKSYLQISGVMQAQRQVDIFLDQVYISLQGVRQQEIVADVGVKYQGDDAPMKPKVNTPPGSSDDGGKGFSSFSDGEPGVKDLVVPDLAPQGTKTVTKRVDLAEAVRDHQYSVILGDPGAGKTTLLNYLALHYAKAQRDSQEKVQAGEDDLGKPLLPVFLRIADYAEQLVQQPELSLLGFLEQFYGDWEVRLEAGGGRLEAEGRRQEAEGRRQEAGGRRQEAGVRSQESGGGRQEVSLTPPRSNPPLTPPRRGT
ncbi:MAG: hypothetical protein F6K47_17730, partial [Symploca sp. SIO2E6]|nr:hypothetical protein [Symploca sp. SIO2E6]